jgi:hypothetical protein
MCERIRGTGALTDTSLTRSCTPLVEITDSDLGNTLLRREEEDRAERFEREAGRERGGMVR